MIGAKIHDAEKRQAPNPPSHVERSTNGNWRQQFEKGRGRAESRTGNVCNSHEKISRKNCAARTRTSSGRTMQVGSLRASSQPQMGTAFQNVVWKAF